MRRMLAAAALASALALPVRAASLEKGLQLMAEKLVPATASTGSIVAVLPFTGLDGSGTQLGLYLTDQLQSELQGVGNFEVADPALVQKALADVTTGPVLLDLKTIRDLGRALGADFVVSGTYTDLLKQLELKARVVNTDSGSVDASAQTRVDQDGNIRVLLERKIALGRAAPSPEPSSSPSGPQRGSLLYEDDNKKPDGTRALNASANDPIKAYYLSGDLRLVSPLDAPPSNSRYYYNYGPMVQDFIWEATIRKSGGLDNHFYGLFFRLGPKTGIYYFAAINGLGEYSIGKGQPAGYAVLRQGHDPAVLRNGAPNHLKVICQGPKIELYANGQLVGSVQDSDSITGTQGIGVDNGLQLAVRDLRLYSIR